LRNQTFTLSTIRRTLAAGIAAIAITSAAFAQGPAYLAEMPSVAAVRTAVKGTSLVDTLAHQAAVFNALQQILEVRTERPGSLADPSRLSLAERATIEAYRQAVREIFATPGVDRAVVGRVVKKMGAGELRSQK